MPDSVKRAGALNACGNTYSYSFSDIASIPCYERALAIQERHYGPDHPELAATLTSLGSAYGDLGDAAKQKALLERALAINERHYGPDHASVAITLMNLGNAYGALGDAAKKKTLLERALAINERELIHVISVLASDTMEELRIHLQRGRMTGGIGVHNRTLLMRAAILIVATRANSLEMPAFVVKDGFFNLVVIMDTCCAFVLDKTTVQNAAARHFLKGAQSLTQRLRTVWTTFSKGGRLDGAWLTLRSQPWRGWLDSMKVLAQDNNRDVMSAYHIALVCLLDLLREMIDEACAQNAFLRSSTQATRVFAVESIYEALRECVEWNPRQSTLTDVEQIAESLLRFEFPRFSGESARLFAERVEKYMETTKPPHSFLAATYSEYDVLVILTRKNLSEDDRATYRRLFQCEIEEYKGPTESFEELSSGGRTTPIVFQEPSSAIAGSSRSSGPPGQNLAIIAPSMVSGSLEEGSEPQVGDSGNGTSIELGSNASALRLDEVDFINEAPRLARHFTDRRITLGTEIVGPSKVVASVGLVLPLVEPQRFVTAAHLFPRTAGDDSGTTFSQSSFSVDWGFDGRRCVPVASVVWSPASTDLKADSYTDHAFCTVLDEYKDYLQPSLTVNIAGRFDMIFNPTSSLSSDEVVSRYTGRKFVHIGCKTGIQKSPDSLKVWTLAAERSVPMECRNVTTDELDKVGKAIAYNLRNHLYFICGASVTPERGDSCGAIFALPEGVSSDNDMQELVYEFEEVVAFIRSKARDSSLFVCAVPSLHVYDFQ